MLYCLGFPRAGMRHSEIRGDGAGHGVTQPTTPLPTRPRPTAPPCASQLQGPSWTTGNDESRHGRKGGERRCPPGLPAGMPACLPCCPVQPLTATGSKACARPLTPHLPPPPFAPPRAHGRASPPASASSTLTLGTGPCPAPPRTEPSGCRKTSSKSRASPEASQRGRGGPAVAQAQRGRGRQLGGQPKGGVASRPAGTCVLQHSMHRAGLGFFSPTHMLYPV